jgi:glycosyltransferase involved in cell wall biosynthesis
MHTPNPSHQAKPLVSVIVPCFNEQEVLPQLFDRLTRAADTWDMNWEVLCMDDGSRDLTWDLLSKQQNADSRWKGIRFSRNFGHQSAVSAGLYHAMGDVVIVIDADLQDPPEQLVRFLEKWREGYQVVYGIRASQQDRPLKKILAWGFYRIIASLVTFNIPPDSGDFCLMDRKVVDVMNALPERNKYLRGLRAWCGFRQIGLQFERHARAAGAPQYTFRKSLRLALDGIFSFSAVPLSIASHLGLFVSSLALLGMLFTLLQRIFAGYFAHFGLEPGPGFATIVLSILFLGGVQLICLGILGEYLGRIYDEVKSRPSWIIFETAGLPLQLIRNGPMSAERTK